MAVSGSRSHRAVFDAVCAVESLRKVAALALVDEAYLDNAAFADPNLVGRLVTMGMFGLQRATVDNVTVLAPRWTSPLVRQAFFVHLYAQLPRPATFLGGDDYTFVQFLRASLSSIARSELRGNVAFGKTGLYKRQWQMSFYYAVARVVPHNIRISPDVGAVFGSKGYLDFYIDGEKQWGVELLRNGVEVAEHVGRFKSMGIYRKIPLHDFAIVDFRAKPASPTDADRSLMPRGLWIVVHAADFAHFTLYAQHCPGGERLQFVAE
jgi:hypothetical protein